MTQSEKLQKVIENSSIVSKCCNAAVWDVEEKRIENDRLLVHCWKRCDKCQTACNITFPIYFSSSHPQNV